jgi:hypothetical protein
MGLGAGFKFKDKEKGKDIDKAGERDRDYDISRSKHRPGDKDSDDPSNESPAGHPIGWTSVIEDWLCYGHRTALNGAPQKNDFLKPPIRPSPMHSTSGDIHRRISVKDQRKGPYQLLIKERMMGIYLAVYINRDIRDLVRGLSPYHIILDYDLSMRHRDIKVSCGRRINRRTFGKQRRRWHQHKPRWHHFTFFKCSPCRSVSLFDCSRLRYQLFLPAHEGEGFMKHRLANLAKIKVGSWHRNCRVVQTMFTGRAHRRPFSNPRRLTCHG